MAKVSLTILANRPNRHGECVVMLQIAANRKNLRIPTDVSVAKDYWIKKEEKIKGGKDGDKQAASKNVRLTQIISACNVKMVHNQDKVDRMDVQALKKFLLSEAEVVETNFFSYSQKIIEHYKSLGRKKSAELMESTLGKIKDFHGSSSLEFSDIKVRWLEQFEAWCLRTPKKVHGRKKCTELTQTMTLNGVAVYLRNIRTLLNHAISDELTENYPFKKYKIKIEDTLNRNLTTDAVQAIRDYTTEDKREQIARDFFMLQFYLQGINTIDLFWMTPDKVVGNRLQYKRSKTDRYENIKHNVKIEPEAQELIDKYRGQKYLLWFADQNGNEREGWLSSRHARKNPFQYKDEAAFTKMI
ncbi:MAG TPA: site-specific integrase, partial [Prolixibacteraceae bacterium]|nr:site-specific integrase [Prolixibacteraceae bacterium]